MTTQSKTPGEYLALYVKGWTEGDVGAIMAAAAPNYTFDDPQGPSPVPREEFGFYFAGLKGTVEQLRTSREALPFMALSEVVVEQRGDDLAAWCWWSIPGTALPGSGFIRVSPAGVVSEKIAYYTKLA